MFGLGFQELIVILLLALLFFGAKRLPGIAKSLGKSINEFKRGMESKDDDKTQEIEEKSSSEDKSSAAPLKKDKED
ncbi:MAG: twin-arginine translocase TatA/TatE family subunit [Endomicrobium sp.]|jgi:TatA/E family protein of Tat protein translocase|nr:twin-arginine translocase TatA/TatE family subunit [Endomicrobium sp.]